MEELAVGAVKAPRRAPRGNQHSGDAILDGKELIAPAVEGIHSVELANAMILSTLLDDEVAIPLDGHLYESKLQDLIKNSSFQKSVGEAKAVDMSASFGR